MKQAARGRRSYELVRCAGSRFVHAELLVVKFGECNLRVVQGAAGRESAVNIGDWAQL